MLFCKHFFLTSSKIQLIPIILFMKKNIFPLVMSLLMIFLFSCSSDSSDDMEPTPDPDPVTYTNTVNSIMTINCATSTCHDSSSPAQGLDLTNYTNVKDAFVNKNAMGLINLGNMPKNADKLSTSTINKLNDWIANNYEE